MKEVSVKLILILALALAACSPPSSPQMKTVACDVDGDGIVEPVGIDVRALDSNGDVKVGDRVLHCTTNSPTTNPTLP